MFATAFGHLNDAAEIEHARGVFDSVIRARIAIRATAELHDSWIQQALGWLSVAGRPRHRSGDLDIEGQVAVFSLSADGDSLGQWRAYGGLAPLAIGFHRTALGHVERATLAKCVYTQEEASAAFDSIADQLIYELETNQLMTTSLQSRFYAVAATIKHPSFREEREWRLITDRFWPRAMKLRSTDSRVVPYVELRFVEAGAGDNAPLPLVRSISAIRVGPGRHDGMTFDALQRVLEGDGIVVDRSEIPFRSLS